MMVNTNPSPAWSFNVLNGTFGKVISSYFLAGFLYRYFVLCLARVPQYFSASEGEKSMLLFPFFPNLC